MAGAGKESACDFCSSEVLWGGFWNFQLEDIAMKIIKTANFDRPEISGKNHKNAADVEAGQGTDIPVTMPSGEERLEDDQLPETRMNQKRRNWYEALRPKQPPRRLI